MQNFKHYFIFIILILIVSVSIYSQNNNDTIRRNKPLRILSWNIYILPAPIYPKVFKKERAVQIVDTLLKCDYDIIVFQELFQRKVRNYFYKNFANKYPYHYGPVNYKFFSLRFNGGVVVFSKFPLQLKKQFIFKACRGFEKFAKKGAMLLEGEWQNTKFQIIGTHIQAYSPLELKYKQMVEINNKLLRPYYTEGVSQIICGDMNTNAHTQNDYEGMLSIFGIEDGKLTGERRYSKANGREIDYILVRKNENNSIKIKRDVKVFPPKTNSQFKELSDHYAIEAEIQF